MKYWLARASTALLTWCAIASCQSGKAADQTPPLIRLDCSKPSINPERYICDSPYLRRLWKLAENSQRSLFDVNPMRVSMKSDTETWFASKVQRGQNFDLQNVLADRYRENQRSLSAVQAALSGRYSEEDVNKTCVALAPPFFETLLLTCRAEAVEGIAPGLVGQRQSWNGPPERDQALVPLSALAILEFDPSQATRTYQLVVRVIEPDSYS